MICYKYKYWYIYINFYLKEFVMRFILIVENVVENLFDKIIGIIETFTEKIKITFNNIKIKDWITAGLLCSTGEKTNF